MSDGILRGLLLAAALGSGLAAGIFFGCSTFVMRALGRIPPPQGIAAMQSINVAVINPLFMAVFLGTGVPSLVLVVDPALRWERPGSALAAVDPASAQGSTLWSAYLAGWTAWNHVRTVASLVAAALFTLALK